MKTLLYWLYLQRYCWESQSHSDSFLYNLFLVPGNLRFCLCPQHSEATSLDVGGFSSLVPGAWWALFIWKLLSLSSGCFSQLLWLPYSPLSLMSFWNSCLGTGSPKLVLQFSSPFFTVFHLSFLLSGRFSVLHLLPFILLFCFFFKYCQELSIFYELFFIL